jgi:Domain of unknown function (DUF4279)
MEEAYAYFWIEGFDCDISEITRVVGLEPTEAWNRGQAVAAQGGQGAKERVWKFSSWALYSPLPREVLVIDDHITALVDIVEPRRQPLNTLRSQGIKMGINCVGRILGNPGFHLAAPLIARCAGLGLSLDFDLYCQNE